MQSNLVTAPPQFSSRTASMLRHALESNAAREPNGAQELSRVLNLLGEESRARGFTAEAMVVALRNAWYAAGRMRRASDDPDRDYYAALGECLVIYFGEKR